MTHLVRSAGLLDHWLWQLPFGARPVANPLDLRQTFCQDRPESRWSTPWFFDHLPWAQTEIEVAKQALKRCAEASVLVRGLPTNWGGGDPAPYICAYEPARWDLHLEDLQRATMIDLRLHAVSQGMTQGASEPARAIGTASGQPLPPESSPAIGWPPDVEDLRQLTAKCSTIRQLAPQASLVVSIHALQADTAIEQLLPLPIDGILLRAVDGAPAILASTIAELLVAHQPAVRRANKRLLVVCPLGTAEDAVKLLCCGASAVALDDLVDDTLPRRALKPSAAAVDSWTVPTAPVVAEDRFAPRLHNVLNEARYWLEQLNIQQLDQLSTRLLHLPPR